MKDMSEIELYKEKMQIHYHTPAEADVIWKKSAEKIAKKMILGNEPLEKIIEYTELPEKRILAIKKRMKI